MWFIEEFQTPFQLRYQVFFSKDIVVNVNVGKLEKEESENDYTYFFEDTIQENQVTFSVFIKQKNRRIKLVGSWDFRLKEIPKPIICLGSNCTNGFLLYENLQKPAHFLLISNLTKLVVALISE